MKQKYLIFFSLLLFLFLSLSPNVNAATIATSSAKFVDDEVIVSLKSSAPSSDINPIAQSISGEVLRELLLKQNFILKVPKGSVEKVIKTILDMPQVATATPNYIVQKQALTNDPSLEKEWGMFQIQAASSTSKSAWDKTSGKPEVKVAVLDTGIEKTHPDLEGKIIGEKNFTDNTDLGDHDGHGTLVAGIIAATGNNLSGIAGVSYGTSILNVKVLNDEGIGTYADVIDGIIWATDNGAKVINLSLGGSSDMQLMEEAVNYAYNKGSLLVAAVGNNGTNSVMYPANYENVLSVSATDDADMKLITSNYGTSVKVAAPGDKIYSTYKNNSYSYASGTSMAAAFTSGVAALVWSTDTCATNSCVSNRIENTSDKVAETGKNWKFGRINALKAVTDSSEGSPISISDTVTPSISPVQPIVLGVPPAPSTIIEPTKVPTPTINQNSITVSNIEMWTSRVFSRRDLFVRVNVVKQSDKTKVNNAVVTIDLTSPDGTIYSASSITNTDGQAIFSLKGVKKVGIYKTLITDVKLNSFTYSPTKSYSQLYIF